MLKPWSNKDFIKLSMRPSLSSVTDSNLEVVCERGRAEERMHENSGGKIPNFSQYS